MTSTPFRKAIIYIASDIVQCFPQMDLYQWFGYSVSWLVISFFLEKVFKWWLYFVPISNIWLRHRLVAIHIYFIGIWAIDLVGSISTYDIKCVESVLLSPAAPKVRDGRYWNAPVCQSVCQSVTFRFRTITRKTHHSTQVQVYAGMSWGCAVLFF